MCACSIAYANAYTMHKYTVQHILKWLEFSQYGIESLSQVLG